MRNQLRAGTLVGLWMLITIIGTGVRAAAYVAAPSPAPAGIGWETKARLQRRFNFTDERGTLRIDDKGVMFESEGGRKQSWTFLDIHSVEIKPHRIILQSYVSRTIGGDKEYRFDFTGTMPPSVAAAIASALQRPSQNAVPDLQSQELASIHARHWKLGRGTNGVLRFRHDGIDYVTNAPGDSRSWRWADLQSVSAPDPFHLLVFGYRDNYSFDLKEPLPRTLVDEASADIFEMSRSSAAAAPTQSVRAK